MFKCIICENRKGKRYCPLKDAMICSQCCGLVQTEGNCPTDCPFFKESKVFASEKQDEREDQLGERFKRNFSAENDEAMQTFNAVSKPLNDLFLDRAEKDEFLEDKDLVEALDDLIKDLEAGIGQVVSPEAVKLNRAGALVPVMKQALDALPPEPPVPGHLITPCLEILRGLVSLSAKADNPKAYIQELLKQKEEAKAQAQAQEEEEVVPAGEPVTVDVSEAQATSEAAQEAPSASDLFEASDDVKDEG